MKAIIFDMDGVIIDSEPFWQQAEVDVFNRYGIPVTLEMAASTMGLRIDLVVEHWFKVYPCDVSVEQVANEILDGVAQRVASQGEALPGLYALIQRLQHHQIPLGLATSSAMRLAQTTLHRLGLENTFIAVFSAEQLAYGKPHPQVYLECAHAMAISPLDCLAIEDSITGLIAAKAARMKAIAIPPLMFADKSGYGIADVQLSSLNELTDEKLLALGFTLS